MENFGYIKVACANYDVNVANVKANGNRILPLINEAMENGSSIIIFGQLSLTGYTCQDLFLKSYLVDQCIHELAYIKTNMPTGIIAVIGMPIRFNWALYNCAIVVEKDNIIGVIPKTNINKNEQRWFTSGLQVSSQHIKLCDQVVPFGSDIIVCQKDLKLSVSIGEDVNLNMPYDGDANLVIDIASDVELVNTRKQISNVVSANSVKHSCAYIYNSNGFGESSSDYVYSQMCVGYQNGILLDQSHNNLGLTYMFVDIEKANNDMLNKIHYNDNVEFIPCNSNVFKYSVLPDCVDAYPFIPKGEDKIQTCLNIINIQARGLANRLKIIHCDKVVIGISGGLDSTLALLVCVEAFKLLEIDSNKIIAITLPGLATTSRTKNNAVELMKIAQTSKRTINISESVIQHLKDIDHPLDLYDIAYENAQARERTQILMDVANMEQAIVVGTGDLSELALGWCTYNGDHMSNYSVNGSIPKTLVKELVKAYADSYIDYKKVLYDILDTPISPELIPSDDDDIAQKTEEKIGKYDLHDFFIYHFMANSFSKQKILALAKIAFKNVSEKQIEETLNVFYHRFYTQQFKRSCLPDGPTVGIVGVSPRGGWMMSSDISKKIEENN